MTEQVGVASDGLGDLDVLGAAWSASLEDVLASTLELQGERLLAVSADLAPVVDAVRVAAAGGKRVRAALVMAGWAGARVDRGPVSGRPAPAPEHVVLRAAAALELFHLAALVHDDVMDRSELRRGRPTVHRTFAEQHRRDGYAGAARGYGDAVAVLVGDLCLSWSDELVSGALADLDGAPDGLHHGTAAGARQVYDLMRSQVMAGQFLDVLEQHRGGSDAEAVRRVTTFKSAKYTVEQPLLLGGRLGGATPVLLEQYAAFGLAVGEAFQLRDDLLGVFGDPGRTGKPCGDDLREGKRTLLLTLAEQRAGTRGRDLLRAGVGDPDLDEAGLAELRLVLVETGAVTEVERRIDGLVAHAHDRLGTMTVPPDVRRRLHALATACAWRSS